MANCPSPIPVAVEPDWLRSGLAIAAEQSNPLLGKVALLNHLAMAAARGLLQWLEIPCDYGRDRPPISLWGGLDFAELAVVEDGTERRETAETTGKILCRPVIVGDIETGNGDPNPFDELLCELPMDIPEETVACMPVGFDESLQRAWIWGYVPVAGFEVGVRGTREFRLGAVPWRSLDELGADLERWMWLSQALSTQTDLCDRLSALLGPVPLVSLVAQWQGSSNGATLLHQYWQDSQEASEQARQLSADIGADLDPLKSPVEDVLSQPLELTDWEEDGDDYYDLDREESGLALTPSLAFRSQVRGASPSSPYRADAESSTDEPSTDEPSTDKLSTNKPSTNKPNEEYLILDAATGEGEITPPVDPMVSRALDAIAQELDQWFDTMDRA